MMNSAETSRPYVGVSQPGTTTLTIIKISVCFLQGLSFDPDRVKTRIEASRKRKWQTHRCTATPHRLRAGPFNPLPDEKAEDGKSESQFSIITFPKP